MRTIYSYVLLCSLISLSFGTLFLGCGDDTSSSPQGRLKPYAPKQRSSQNDKTSLLVAPLRSNTIELNRYPAQAPHPTPNQPQDQSPLSTLTLQLHRAQDDLLVVDYSLKAHELSGLLDFGESISIWLSGDSQNVHFYSYTPLYIPSFNSENPIEQIFIGSSQGQQDALTMRASSPHFSPAEVRGRLVLSLPELIPGKTRIGFGYLGVSRGRHFVYGITPSGFDPTSGLEALRSQDLHPFNYSSLPSIEAGLELEALEAENNLRQEAYDEFVATLETIIQEDSENIQMKIGQAMEVLVEKDPAQIIIQLGLLKQKEFEDFSVEEVLQFVKDYPVKPVQDAIEDRSGLLEQLFLNEKDRGKQTFIAFSDAYIAYLKDQGEIFHRHALQLAPTIVDMLLFGEKNPGLAEDTLLNYQELLEPLETKFQFDIYKFLIALEQEVYSHEKAEAILADILSADKRDELMEMLEGSLYSNKIVELSRFFERLSQVFEAQELGVESFNLGVATLEVLVGRNHWEEAEAVLSQAAEIHKSLESKTATSVSSGLMNRYFTQKLILSLVSEDFEEKAFQETFEGLEGEESRSMLFQYLHFQLNQKAFQNPLRLFERLASSVLELETFDLYQDLYRLGASILRGEIGQQNFKQAYTFLESLEPVVAKLEEVPLDWFIEQGRVRWIDAGESPEAQAALTSLQKTFQAIELHIANTFEGSEEERDEEQKRNAQALASELIRFFFMFFEEFGEQKRTPLFESLRKSLQERDLWDFVLDLESRYTQKLLQAGEDPEVILSHLQSLGKVIEEQAQKISSGQKERTEKDLELQSFLAKLFVQSVKIEDLTASYQQMDASAQMKVLQNFKRFGEEGNEGLYPRYILENKPEAAEYAFERLSQVLKAAENSSDLFRLFVSKMEFQRKLRHIATAQAAFESAQALLNEFSEDQRKETLQFPERRDFELFESILLGDEHQYTEAIELLQERVKGFFGTQLETSFERQIAFFEALSKDWAEEEAKHALEEEQNLPRVLLQTSQGDIELVLFEDDAPNTVASFIGLVEKNFYDKVTFHRFVPGFAIQGGDPEGDGSGGPGYRIKFEALRKHFRGRIAMARSPGEDKDTAGSQFYFVLANTEPVQRLDENYSVFGRIIRGLDVLDNLREDDTILGAKVLYKRDHDYSVEKISDS